MVGWVSETTRANQWACAAPSTMTADRILMLLMILKYFCVCAKTQRVNARITRVACISTCGEQGVTLSSMNLGANRETAHLQTLSTCYVTTVCRANKQERHIYVQCKQSGCETRLLINTPTVMPRSLGDTEYTWSRILLVAYDINVSPVSTPFARQCSNSRFVLPDSIAVAMFVGTLPVQTVPGTHCSLIVTELQTMNAYENSRCK
jgi:hypothetical protein